ncbi:MAG: hypothetical protein GWP44_03350 [Proteobacteria bacterium]|nr:hypothetical protein [Pseudomonadota bacterium]
MLLDTSRTLSGTLSSEDLFAAIHRETASVLEASGFCIALYDQGRGVAKRSDISYRGSAFEVIRTPKVVLLTKDLDSESLLVLGMDGARLYVGRLTERVAADTIMAEYARASMKSMEDVIQAADMDMCSAKAQRPDSRRSGT